MWIELGIIVAFGGGAVFKFCRQDKDKTSQLIAVSFLVLAIAGAVTGAVAIAAAVIH